MAPQRSGVFKGFDIRNAYHLRRWFDALEYLQSGGRQLDHESIKNLGDSPEEVYERSRTVRGVDHRRNTDIQFATALYTFQSAWSLEDRALVTAAGAFNALIGQIGENAGSFMPAASAANSNSHESNVAGTTRHQSKEVNLPAAEIKYAPSDTPSKDATKSMTNLRSYLPSNSSTAAPSSDQPVSRGRHAPNLQKGYQCYYDGTYPFDRAHVQLGQEPDNSKFRITLRSRKVDPLTPSGYLEGRGAVYEFPSAKGFGTGTDFKPFDWNDPYHIKKLHQWREQVFRRRIGGTRPTRRNWMTGEKYYLLQLIEEQLQTHRRPKFNKLANDFNRRFHGTIQKTGEQPVFTGKVTNGGVLKEDRPAPWRTTAALEGQAFKWQEYQQMLRQKDLQALVAPLPNTNQLVISSDDEREIPDPNPPQTIFKPKKYRPWIGQAAKKAAAQAAAALKKASNTTASRQEPMRAVAGNDSEEDWGDSENDETSSPEETDSD